MKVLTGCVVLFSLTAGLAGGAEEVGPLPDKVARHFRPPEEFAKDFGSYRSPLLFADGSPVRNAADWQKRRQEIRKEWHDLMGPWPELVAKPKIEFLGKEAGDGFTNHRVRVQVAPDRNTDGYLLVPDGKGPFPAVIVVFYEPETAIGKGKGPRRDFALQLVKHGIVTLSIGGAPETYYPDKASCKLQPLSYHAYEAVNCCNALATLPQVDPKRIGITGHSYGGKWALFAACLYDGFACAAWSDPGIVFDEKRSNVNYWDPWYLGFEPGKERKRGLPTPENPSIGPYKKMRDQGHDLHELHALMAPRPFLVSGGSEDQPERWKALNHSIAVNKLLGYSERVGMTNRPTHDPTEESNEVLCLFFAHFLQAKR
jgi:hypothetical protein